MFRQEYDNNSVISQAGFEKSSGMQLFPLSYEDKKIVFDKSSAQDTRRILNNSN